MDWNQTATMALAVIVCLLVSKAAVFVLRWVRTTYYPSQCECECCGYAYDQGYRDGLIDAAAGDACVIGEAESEGV